jgi:diaminopropionate ammonia-lyase
MLPLTTPYQLFANPAFRADAPYSPALQSIISLEAFAQARDVITAWPGYAPTPVYHLSGLARALGVKDIVYKDEAFRFGLNSFKGLGGPYAVYCLLESQIRAQTGVSHVSVHDIIDGTYRDIVSSITVSTATDGNHGRAVAWGAQLFGCGCVIYIHSRVSEGRKKAIEAYGAKVVRTPGNYDDSVRQAQADATAHGRFIISDTSYEGYMEVAKDVMQGYTVMVQEVLDVFSGGVTPTHVFLQCGVGAMAAGIVAHLWEKNQLAGKPNPRFIMVEPDKADCLIESAKAGKPVAVHGDLDTIMAGLACGEVSLLAWDILLPSTSHFMTVTDEAAMATMRLLAQGLGGDAPVVAGESAVGGLAGLLAIYDKPEARAQLGLTDESVVLIFGSEGDSDPVLYEKIVGKNAAEVRQGVLKAATA